MLMIQTVLAVCASITLAIFIFIGIMIHFLDSRLIESMQSPLTLIWRIAVGLFLAVIYLAMINGALVVVP